MSINVSAELYIHCVTNVQCKRLQFYFNEDTRPDFLEDVPEDEADWVEPFEFLENPNHLKVIDDKTLLVAFYPEETDFTDDAREIIKTLLHVVRVESIIYCELGEDWTMFQYYTKDNSQLLWSVDGLDDSKDDEKYNSFLSEEEKETFQVLLYGKDYEKQDVETIMFKLTQKLSIE